MNETLSYVPPINNRIYTIDFTKYSTKEELKTYVETLDCVKNNKISSLQVYSNYASNNDSNGFKKVKYGAAGASGSNKLNPTLIEFKSFNLESIYISMYIVANAHFWTGFLEPGATSAYSNKLLQYERGDNGVGYRNFYDDNGEYHNLSDLANYENKVFEATVKMPSKFDGVDGSVYFMSLYTWNRDAQYNGNAYIGKIVLTYKE